MAAMLLQIDVGIPENTKTVTVSADTKISQLLKEANVTAKGAVLHNGDTLSASDLDKTLEELGAVNRDSFLVVKKMNSAKR